MNDQDKKQSDTHAHSVVPRKAVFKVRGNTAGVIDKKELIAYPANALSSHLNVGANDTNKKITFLLSGDCFVDGMESYVSLRLKVNKYTAYLSSDVTSIVKRLVLSLPSNSNQVLEDINEYATLQSILHQANGSDEAFAANWHSGQNCLANYNKESGAASARRFLNMGDEGEYRTLTFQLNLSGILSSQNYLPLMLLNGLKLELHLSSASEAFHYDATKEASWDTVFACVEAPFAKKWSDMSAAERDAVTAAFSDHLAKPDPPNSTAQLEYTIESPTFHAMTVWMSPAYTQSLVTASNSATGVLLNYDTFKYNQIVPESPYVNFAFPDSLQNVKCAYFGAYLRQKAQASHFNYVTSSLKSFTFRIGSRIFNQVVNDPALAVTSTLLSLGKLGSYAQSSLGYTTYPRSKNVHVYDFQSARAEQSSLNSGLDTTNGRHRRVELNFDTGASIAVTSPDDNTSLVTLKKASSFQDTALNTFLEFSKYIRINSAGILVVE